MPDPDPNDACMSPISSTFASLIFTSLRSNDGPWKPQDTNVALQVEELAITRDRVG
jgi:hypothetical protein